MDDLSGLNEKDGGKYVKEYILEAGETLVMPAGKPHAVYGQEAFKMLLTVIFPLEG